MGGSLYLSTPHGALGTGMKKSQGFFCCLLSTPHGALGTSKGGVSQGTLHRLSTPHGALGTERRAGKGTHPANITFNSTRCIRNNLTLLLLLPLAILSTPHGALGTSNCHIN